MRLCHKKRAPVTAKKTGRGVLLKEGRAMKKKFCSGYLFILPIVILFLIFIVYPICYNFYISFYEWNGINIDKVFVGLENYKNVLRDPIMQKIIRNFVIFALFTIIIQAFFGLVFADFCNGVQREHNKKLNNGLPILHKVPPKRDYGRYFCIMAKKGGTSHGGLTEKLSPFFHA